MPDCHNFVTEEFGSKLSDIRRYALCLLFYDGPKISFHIMLLTLHNEMTYDEVTSILSVFTSSRADPRLVPYPRNVSEPVRF